MRLSQSARATAARIAVAARGSFRPVDMLFPEEGQACDIRADLHRGRKENSAMTPPEAIRAALEWSCLNMHVWFWARSRHSRQLLNIGPKFIPRLFPLVQSTIFKTVRSYASQPAAPATDGHERLRLRFQNAKREGLDCDRYTIAPSMEVVMNITRRSAW